jgi:hypothetical protein
MKRQDHNPYKLVAAHDNLRSYPTMPSHLGGEPPRVTNASKAFRRESQVLKLWDALAQLIQAHKGLNSQPNTRIWLEKKISQREKERERELGSVSLALAYVKQQGKHLSNHRNSSSNKWSPWGTYTPHKEN